MEEKTIYDLKLHETLWISGADLTVIKVAGGWIYQEYDTERDQPIGVGTFVPFNNEYQKIK